jgi:hypothetical protein
VRQRTFQWDDCGAERKVRATLPPCLPVAPTMAMVFLLDADIATSVIPINGQNWRYGVLFWGCWRTILWPGQRHLDRAEVLYLPRSLPVLAYTFGCHQEPSRYYKSARVYLSILESLFRLGKNRKQLPKVERRWASLSNSAIRLFCLFCSVHRDRLQKSVTTDQ